MACMPNTNPVNDNANVTAHILAKATEANLARVYPIGAVSRGSNGELLADIAELRQAGCVAITDDGRPVATALPMRRAMEQPERSASPSSSTVRTLAQGGRRRARGLPRGRAGPARHAGRLRGTGCRARHSSVGGDRSAFHVAHMSARASLRAARNGKNSAFA